MAAESQGLDIVKSSNTSIAVVFGLRDSAGAKITSGSATARIWHILPATGALETYDFNDDTFKTGAITTATVAMTHQTAENGTYNTGNWVIRHATLTAFVDGDKYVIEASHADLTESIPYWFQYGGADGDVAA